VNALTPLEITPEPNPWGTPYAPMDTSAHVPQSGDEVEPLLRTTRAISRASYGFASPTRRRSANESGTRRKRGTLAGLLRWHGRAQSQTRYEQGATSPENGEQSYLSSKLWWVGFLLMNVGEVGNFISYGFAPASVVAPLGTFALVANCFFSPLILHERFRKRDLLGIVIAIIGAVTVVLSANTSDTRLSPRQIIAAVSTTIFITFSAVYVVCALLLVNLSGKPVGYRYVIIDVGLCALFGGFTVLATKGVSTLLTTRGLLMFKEWITYPIIAVLIGTGVGQIRYLNRALMRFDSKVVIPIQFVLFNLSAIVGSAILYGDFRKTTFHQFVTFLYGCGATFAGVFIIATDTSDSSQVEQPVETSGVDSDEAAGDTGAREPRSIRKILIIRPRESILSLAGLSPAQNLLLVRTPQLEDSPSARGRDFEQVTRQSQRRCGQGLGRQAVPIEWRGDSPESGSVTL